MGKAAPTRSRLWELFEDTGTTVRRRIRQGKASAGAVITSVGNHGYYRVRVDGAYQLVHRLLWIMRTGVEPSLDIDHKDGNKLNNSPGNLRLATHGQNMQNAKRSRRNTSGYAGVSRHAQSGKWAVAVMANKRSHSGGLFHDFNDACVAADTLRLKLHGAFANGREVCYRQES